MRVSLADVVIDSVSLPDIVTMGLDESDTVRDLLAVEHLSKKLQIVMTILLYDPVIKVPRGAGVGGERMKT